ncbi:up-regulator of cell proliferation-like [Hyperolius riggenbachi]|uniref:up-regulator of cell proliferation-like n=1 Tax=Hyperolius riggenbachi TaxID=752182 RepID=UPI0035A302F8
MGDVSIQDDMLPSDVAQPIEDASSIKDREKRFKKLVKRVKMEQHLTSKLTLRNMLSINLKDLQDKQCGGDGDLPWKYLRKLMALNRDARQILPNMKQSVTDDDNLFNAFSTEGEIKSIHPLDILCVLLHCSDSFLQQEIVTKMAMCQFAVPLLLPSGDGSNCTFMLWAMRDIVKKWRPGSLANSKGFREDNLVNIPMPIFSFVRLGQTKLSKSKMLNQVLNSAQLHNNFFIHDNMEGGNIERKISDGLVEMSWYFPCGRSDIFSEPIAVTNLRGDVESNWDQFMFLSQVSPAVFIFIESISEREFTLLSSCSNTDTQYYFIVTPGHGKYVSTQTQKALQDLSPLLKIKKSNVITYAGERNEALFVRKLQDCLGSLLNKDTKNKSMSDLEYKIPGFHFHMNERLSECQKARECARQITKEIKDVAAYKKKTMVLQGDLWKQISKIEKELCRMTHQGSTETTQYQHELKTKYFSLCEKQHNYKVPNGIKLFIGAITDLNETGKQYFLKWMKFELDSIARKHLSELQAEYKDQCNNKSIDKEVLQKIDQKISDSSLGIEHFLREMGQFYEAECSVVKKNKLPISKKQFTGLPGIAANLLLEGFPLELIDGDVSNIPLQWITDVLTQLDKKIGEKCKIRVITVLGVQSTGKSTLLNTMFGLQFPVASGRCTRGAFMTLLNVKNEFRKILGCHYIMVIDTEGLKAPELASLEGSHEHDNELATLVIGLSDITIVNMAMENKAEMEDILQIAVHAFLRMKEVGKRPNCQFVHQNVSDVSAHDMNMRDRRKFLEQLNKMTKVAANMEKKLGIKGFNDVMDYDLEKDNWYIPGLWLGVPPMAPVNSGYSGQVHELKKYLLEFMKSKNSVDKPLSIPDFIEWMKSLWNAVKHEKFLFSFRNSLVAQAYNKLSAQFSQWGWEFRKTVHDWLISTETIIKNQSAESLNVDLCSGFRDELSRLLLKEKNKMTDLLEKYFENKTDNAQYLQRYKEDFVLSTEFLRKELERNALNKCDEAFSIQKGKIKIQSIQCNSQTLIEDKITDLLRRCRGRNQKLNNNELRKEFEIMWKETVTDLHMKEFQRLIVSKSILQQLRNDMDKKGPVINQKLLNVENLEASIQHNSYVNAKYLENGWVQWFKEKIGLTKEPYDKLNNFALALIDKCGKYIEEKVSTAEDYDDTYCQELLRKINTELSDQSNDLHFTSEFELDIKLHIFGRASRAFQKMHDSFITENDTKRCLENLKNQYLQTFLNTFQKKDMCRSKAEEFCNLCLQPALKDHIFRHLGKEIVNDIVNGSDKIFSSRTFFQSFLLKELLEEMSFQKYVNYIHSYEKYTSDWTINYIKKKYAKPKSLKVMQEKILSSVISKVTDVLEEGKHYKHSSVSGFLNWVCKTLNKDLVIPQNEMKVVAFQNTSSVKEFASDIQSFVLQVKEDILLWLQDMDFTSVLNKVTVKPQDELFRQVVGCKKQCPFCKVPCEAGGDKHKEHFATVHRPEGLGNWSWEDDRTLTTDICSASVLSNSSFRNSDTGGNWHPYKDYRTYYPDWAIQPDPSIESSDYWRYIFAQFNEEFARKYGVNPARLPDSWKTITKEQALHSLQKVFNEI